MKTLMAFAKGRIAILSRAEAASSLKGGHNVWGHRKAEVELLLEEMAELELNEKRKMKT